MHLRMASHSSSHPRSSGSSHPSVTAGRQDPPRWLCRLQWGLTSGPGGGVQALSGSVPSSAHKSSDLSWALMQLCLLLSQPWLRVKNTWPQVYTPSVHLSPGSGWTVDSMTQDGLNLWPFYLFGPCHGPGQSLPQHWVTIPTGFKRDTPRPSHLHRLAVTLVKGQAGVFRPCCCPHSSGPTSMGSLGLAGAS